MYWMMMPLRRYADFSGRSCRKEFWMFTLLNFLILAGIFIAMFLFAGMGNMQASQGFFGLTGVFISMACIYGLAIIIPWIAVQVRRFHDQDKSGWMVLLNFVPYVGGIIVLVFMCLEGTKGENSYGPDPRSDDMRFSQMP
ncbi:MAG: DUF805 domain-containing protein [Sphingobium sp.]